MQDSENYIDWSERLNSQCLAIGAKRFREIRDRVEAACLEGGVWWEEESARTPIPVMLRPRLIDLSCRGYVHHVTWQVRMGLRRVVKLVAENPQAAAALPLEAREREWFMRYRHEDRPYSMPAGPRIFCRLDALVRFDGPGWRDTLKFVETNTVGIGGMSYAPVAQEVVCQEVVPELMPDEDHGVIDRGTDPRWLLIDELDHHSRTLGVKHSPVIAFVDDKSLYTLGGEFGRLVPYFHSRGVKALYVDPRELEVSHEGHVVAQGQRVDVCYRFLEMRELIEMEDRGEPMEGMKRAFAQGMVIPTAGGDLEHKSAFELLTDPAFRSAFDAEQARVFDEHVLWTRLLYERKTTGPAGNEVEIVPHARQNRETLVIKPNRLYGGIGVVIGECSTEKEWDAALEKALSDPGSHVVQLASPHHHENFPVLLPSGELVTRPYFATTGFFPGRNGMGIFGRYAATRVVNIKQGGGIVAFLINVR